jgi:hypothetical protein
MNINENNIHFSAAMIKDIVKVSLPVALANEKPLINQLKTEELDVSKIILEMKDRVTEFFEDNYYYGYEYVLNNCYYELKVSDYAYFMYVFCVYGYQLSTQLKKTITASQAKYLLQAIRLSKKHSVLDVNDITNPNASQLLELDLPTTEELENYANVFVANMYENSEFKNRFQVCLNHEGLRALMMKAAETSTGIYTKIVEQCFFSRDKNKLPILNHSHQLKKDVLFLMQNQPLLSKGLIFINEESTDQKVSLPLLMTLLKAYEQQGYILSSELLSKLVHLPTERFKIVGRLLLVLLQHSVGSHEEFEPMYVNFPDEVMNMSESILYANAVKHYLAAFFEIDYRPAQIKKLRKPLAPTESQTLKMLKLGTEEDSHAYYRNLLNSNTNLGVNELTSLKFFFMYFGNEAIPFIPSAIKYRENMAHIIKLAINYTDIELEQIKRYFQNSTDVLRLAVALSDGDVSLAPSQRNVNQQYDYRRRRYLYVVSKTKTKTHFKKFSRSERRLLLALLDQCKNILEDLYRYRELWLMLADILHPGSYEKRYANAAKAIKELRSTKKYANSYNRKVDQLFHKGLDTALLSLLKQRAGEFARRLDMLLRKFQEADQSVCEKIIAQFDELSVNVSTPMLMQIHCHFKNRQNTSKYRYFMPKGGKAQLFRKTEKLPELSVEKCQRIVQIAENAMIKRFSALPSLGKVYVEPALNKIYVPYSQRSASKSLRSIPRGSRLAIPEGSTIRLFLWWKEGEVNGKPTGRIDLDLSACLFDSNWNYKTHLSYTHLVSKDCLAVHSGDITSAPHGASEFIDLNINAALANGARYIFVLVNSYTHIPFSNIPECYMGWMMRNEPGSGEIFEPSTVVDRIDLTSTGKLALPMVFDLETRELIWADLEVKTNDFGVNNFESNYFSTAKVAHAISSIKKFDLYELFSLHAKARGQLVENKEEADTVFSIHEGIRPYDIDKIMGEFIK